MNGGTVMSIYKEQLDGLHTSVSAEDIFTCEAAKAAKRRWKKRYFVIPVALAAVLALTGAVVHEVYRIGFEESDIISELKVGRYYLETVDGYDMDCYIEVFDNYTLQIFGIEKKDDFGNGNYTDWNSAPVKYGLLKDMPGICLNDAWDSLSDYLYDDRFFFMPKDVDKRKYDHLKEPGFTGIDYEDENTLVLSTKRDEHPNAKDYTKDNAKESRAIFNDEEYPYITVHLVYEGAI